jgi:hypothetical protein
MRRRRAQRRERRKSRAGRGAPSVAGFGGRRGSNGPEEWVTTDRALVEERERRDILVDGIGEAHLGRVKFAEGPDGESRVSRNDRRLAPLNLRRHMSAASRPISWVRC